MGHHGSLLQGDVERLVRAGKLLRDGESEMEGSALPHPWRRRPHRTLLVQIDNAGGNVQTQPTATPAVKLSFKKTTYTQEGKVRDASERKKI